MSTVPDAPVEQAAAMHEYVPSLWYEAASSSGIISGSMRQMLERQLRDMQLNSSIVHVLLVEETIMEEGLVQACVQLRLTDEEQNALNLEDVVDVVIEEKTELCMVGRLLTRKPYNLNNMKNALISAWRLARGFNIRDVGDNLFICEFFSKADRGRILREGPWHFDKQIILFEELNGNMQPNNLMLDRCPVWVRIYDLPLNCRGTAAVGKIGAKIGRIIERDDEEGKGWNMYCRIRVLIDTTKPLMRGTKVINLLGEHCWISFKYERIQNFCYWCGLLDHMEVECEDKPETTEVSEWPYGPGLRATPRKRKMM
ncbi:uncharacterized protein LOC126681928 [Mercurialis annua]|uniref:uncharacterized protein LOC126681928 n=1 Tax=Mercurialis annua TaxID=3986 RepID=UPI002160A192|nr:uncharacterized protein LOC126681928 [Mercurialis annua]